MATHFFEQQDQARQRTTGLVVMFLFAVAAMVAATTGIVFAVIHFYGQTNPRFRETSGGWELPLLVGVATLVVILLGTLFKVVMLRSGGGSSVAESLGGKRIFPNTVDPDERRVLNVVEEMALASGTPVPPVFLLADESSINAFAAGYSPSDAVIGVTAGAVHALSREELQGVMAHEFSHILNGDMRLGIRLIGILHGILLLGLIGHTLFRVGVYSGHSSRRSGSGKDSGGGGAMLVLLAVSVALIVIGSLGGVIGNLIKAAVSRQREFLADASAVQFTRNPMGLSSALKHIGGFARGSVIKHPEATEASHLFFAKGVTSGLASWLATHPPLEQRIRALEPNWDGRFPDVKAQRVSNSRAGGSPIQAATKAGLGHVQQLAPEREASSSNFRERGNEFVLPSVVTAAIEQAGQPLETHRHYAVQLTRTLPKMIHEATHDPYGSRALIFALLLDRDESIREQQFLSLVQHIDADVVELTRRLAPLTAELDPRLRLPVIDMSLPALRCMTEPQYRRFQPAFRQLVAADRRLSLFEWTLSQIINRHVRSEFEAVPSPITRYWGLQRLGPQCSLLLSSVAHVGHDAEQSRAAFAVAAEVIPKVRLQWMPRDECNLTLLRESLDVLLTTATRLRVELLRACTVCVCADGTVTTTEAELLRGIADLLDCPVPPILSGQPTQAVI